MHISRRILAWRLKVKQKYFKPILLNYTNDRFDFIEKIIYEISIYHFNRMNITLEHNKHFIEFWIFNKNENINFHFDKDEYYEHKTNKTILSCVTYLNDNYDEPTVISNITEDMCSNNNLDNIQLFLSFPKKLKHIAFEGGKYFHAGLNIKNKNVNDRNIIVINLWEKRPKKLNYYIHDNSKTFFKNTINCNYEKDKTILFIENNKYQNINLTENNDFLRRIVLNTKNSSDELLKLNNEILKYDLNKTTNFIISTLPSS